MRSARLSTGAKRGSRARIGRQLRAVSRHMSRGTIAAMQILWWFPMHWPVQPLRSFEESDGCAARPTMYAITFAVHTTGNAELREEVINYLLKEGSYAPDY